MKSYTRESGFTLIELMVVILIIGILGTLVAMTYGGVQSKKRNTERQTDIAVLKSQLETYYAQHSAYPTLENLNNATWRATNMKDLKTADLTDPSWTEKTLDCTTSGVVTTTKTPRAKCYSYEVRATDSAPCNNDASTCAQYTLTATLEGGGTYAKSSLN